MGKAQGCSRRGGTKLQATVASTAVLIGVFIGATCKIRDGRENENYSALRQTLMSAPIMSLVQDKLKLTNSDPRVRLLTSRGKATVQ